MSFKEEFEHEKRDLLENKRPYETAAAIIFGVFFLQQIGFLIFRTIEFLIDFFKSGVTAYYSFTSMTTPTFFQRIINVDSSKLIYVLIGLAALALWYGLIYIFVFRYCQKRGLAKWTWTTLIMFGPTILFMPPYIIYAVYVFRPYFFRFIKTVVEEYKAFDVHTKFKEEIEVEAKED